MLPKISNSVSVVLGWIHGPQPARHATLITSHSIAQDEPHPNLISLDGSVYEETKKSTALQLFSMQMKQPFMYHIELKGIHRLIKNLWEETLSHPHPLLKKYHTSSSAPSAPKGRYSRPAQSSWNLQASLTAPTEIHIFKHCQMKEAVVAGPVETYQKTSKIFSEERLAQHDTSSEHYSLSPLQLQSPFAHGWVSRSSASLGRPQRHEREGTRRVGMAGLWSGITVCWQLSSGLPFHILEWEQTLPQGHPAGLEPTWASGQAIHPGGVTAPSPQEHPVWEPLVLPCHRLHWDILLHVNQLYFLTFPPQFSSSEVTQWEALLNALWPAGGTCWNLI